MEQNSSEKIILNVKNKRRFGKRGFITELFSKEFFDKFREQNPEYKALTNNELLSNWNKITDSIFNIVFNEADGVKLGNNMGDLKLGLLRIHNVIDKRASEEAGKDVKYSNWSTNSKPGKIIWKTEYARLVHFNLRYLGFTAIRYIKTLACQNMRTQGNTFKDISYKYKFIK